MAGAPGIRTIPRMLAHCHRLRRQAAVGGGACAVLPLLAACSTGATSATAAAPLGLGFWLFASVALALVAGLAFVWGRLHERQLSEPALRRARLAWQQQSQLQEAFTWQTDAQHQLRFWQAPGLAATPAPADAVGFQAFGNGLNQVLQKQLPFKGLRLLAAPALHGARFWALSGVPQQDDTGQFVGFTGAALPLDAQQAIALQAAALGPALRVHRAAALVLAHGAAGWQVQAFNPAALRLWPTLSEGQDTDAWWQLLKADLPAQALDMLTRAMANDAQADLPGITATPTAGPTAVIAGPLLEDGAEWQIEAFGNAGPGATGRGLLISQSLAQLALRDDTSGPPEADTFSFTVSHDLRAPIRVVEGFTRIVKEDYGQLLDRVGNDHLDRVLGAATRMNLMIDALLTLARLSTQPLAQQPVNLSQLAAYIMDDLKRGAPERQADIDIEPGLLAHGDPTLLRLVLENLLGNAWKYSGRCHRAQISLRNLPNDALPGRPGLSAARAFVVRDNGAGFDMRSAERLFGLFQRLHSNSDFPGHGVGLASVRRIVKRHGGDIWAEAEVGRGAAFFFTLAG
jgi:signal transduction histidine kinase